MIILEGYEIKHLRPNLKNCRDIFLERLKKTVEPNNRPPGRDSTPGTSEYDGSQRSVLLTVDTNKNHDKLST